MSHVAETDSRAEFAEAIRQLLEGKMSPAALDRAVAYVLNPPSAADARYAATAKISPKVVGTVGECTVIDGQTFTGICPDEKIEGAGTMRGEVITDDLRRLYADTRNFSMGYFQGWVHFVFFDELDAPLGGFSHYRGAGNGIGFGIGRWA